MECFVIRKTMHSYIVPSDLRCAIKSGYGDALLHEFDEIDIPTDTGDVITVVCAYLGKSFARFIFENCWDRHAMNADGAAETGYLNSEGRRFVLQEIYPHLPKSWRDVISLRKIVENIDGKLLEYEDPLWIPSVTDLFGISTSGSWFKDNASFQLPIFKKDRSRMKSLGNNEAYPYWLRSTFSPSQRDFWFVFSNGSCGYNGSNNAFGIVPGFDI